MKKKIKLELYFSRQEIEKKKLLKTMKVNERVNFGRATAVDAAISISFSCDFLWNGLLSSVLGLTREQRIVFVFLLTTKSVFHRIACCIYLQKLFESIAQDVVFLLIFFLNFHFKLTLRFQKHTTHEAIMSFVRYKVHGN